ncbi:MAG: PadR family transcriptional regulator [Acidobacteria bacterium]|nr:PadR family transcriptional regulator [Acidobacteriota bacterium]
MSLSHVLLGLLSTTPASGWDLKRRLGEDPARGWDADLSQIYPALRRLLRGGFVSLKRRRSPQGPPRREYRVTPSGRRELKEWLAEPYALPRPHDGTLARLALLERSLPPDRVRRLQEYRGLLADELKRAATGTTAARRRRRVLLETELAWADAESAALLAGRSLGPAAKERA